MKKTFLRLNIILMLCAISCLVYYDCTGGLALKGFTSFWFVALGAVNLVFARRHGAPGTKFLWSFQAGLILSMAADVCLGIEFLLGTALFAAGHVCYFAAWCTLERLRRRDLIPVALSCAASFTAVYGNPLLQVNDPVMKPILGAYALIIGLMLGKAISNYRARPTRGRLLLLAGSGMFWFSDLMLALSLFGTGGRLTDALCMYTYWPGQSILAHSVFYLAQEKENG